MECLLDCGLNDIGYSGSKYTWGNERKEEDIIWKRLDIMVINDNWDDCFSNTNVQHLPRISSDHCPLLISIGVNQNDHIKYFKF